MKEQILKLIRNKSNLDGIDICHRLELDIEEGYTLLGKMRNEGLIELKYVGARTYYKIK